MKLIKEEIDRIKSLMGLIIEQKISLPILVKGSYSAPKGDADALHSFERRKSDGFGGKMLTKINEKLREVYKAGINPDVTDIKINIDSTNYTVKWEATIDESKDGIAYMGVASRGSAGKTADRRAEGQIDNLMGKLKRNDAEDIKLVLDFKNPSGVYIRQFFYKYSLPETNPSLSQSGDYLRTEKPTEIETTTDDIMFGGGSMEDVTSSTSRKYKSCEGPIFKKGCKDPNTAYKSPDTEGTIYKVQGCIGTIQDGYFGSKTEAALLEKTGKKEFDIDEVGNICKDFKSTDSIVVGGSSNFDRITKTVIDKFEGGYWNGSTTKNENTTKLGICKNHPKGSMGASTETMFGLDRYNGNIESSPEGKEFFKIIDNEKQKLGMDGFCKKWKWLYRGGDKEDELKNLAVKIMKRNFDRNMSNFVKDSETKEKIETVPGLTLHMSYATWNGPGFFKKFANSLEKGVRRGLTDKELIELAIEDRSKTRLLNKDKVANAIKNPN